ncbi:hypothetical protein KP001_03575 [Geomonas subterranea]|uniref:Uncharacterized protein n=1 Tax=Geomonas subterranea TaxID=2847989 RepID=A0ABX8LL32_9BACT|nr:hypothetical protein [Geomonas subterranea]QXE91636.1 hypothetical protein KP001_03575 [Geomonas subterranea]QXM10272.1 hypothetical protein KP002_03920 [Geomonas subterranea]
MNQAEIYNQIQTIFDRNEADKELHVDQVETLHATIEAVYRRSPAILLSHLDSMKAKHSKATLAQLRDIAKYLLEILEADLA